VQKILGMINMLETTENDLLSDLKQGWIKTVEVGDQTAMLLEGTMKHVLEKHAAEYDATSHPSGARPRKCPRGESP
jgi:hypothetical protein